MAFAMHSRTGREWFIGHTRYGVCPVGFPTIKGVKIMTMTLNDMMTIDHVVMSCAGQISDAPLCIWAPELLDCDGTLSQYPDHTGWTLMDGYSGQCSYSGPMMHSSEFVGGGMEREICQTPGYYVALACHDGDEWAVAYKPFPHVNYPHPEGYLHDCPGCELGPCTCVNQPGLAPCISINCERK